MNSPSLACFFACSSFLATTSLARVLRPPHSLLYQRYIQVSLDSILDLFSKEPSFFWSSVYSARMFSQVHGDLVDEKGEAVGRIRLRRTNGNSVVSNVKLKGSTTWNENEAIGW